MSQCQTGPAANAEKVLFSLLEDAAHDFWQILLLHLAHMVNSKVGVRVCVGRHALMANEAFEMPTSAPALTRTVMSTT